VTTAQIRHLQQRHNGRDFIAFVRRRHDTRRACVAKAPIGCTACRLAVNRHVRARQDGQGRALAHVANASENAFGLMRPMTSLGVSCDGMPSGGSGNPRNRDWRSRANVSMPTRSSTPLMTAHGTIIAMSCRLWSLLRVPRRGSAISARYGRGSGSMERFHEKKASTAGKQ